MAETNTLRNIPLFAHLRDADIDRIQGFARQRSYPKNSVIVFEEDPGDSLYVVLKGQVKVVLIGEDGREVILSTPSNGDFFGEMSLIDDQPRSAHVIAMEDSQLLVLRREDFHQCLTAMPGIAPLPPCPWRCFMGLANRRNISAKSIRRYQTRSI